MTLTVAEWVLPGHPDKTCDAVADRIVGEALRTDSMAQCGVEVACAFHHIFVTGLVGSMQDGWPELAALMPGWIRSTYRDAGYGDPWNPEPGALRIDLEALRFENRTGPWRELRHLSDDQAICIGYAQATPETDYLPGAHSYARKIARALFEQRARDDFDSRVLKDLGPDGKVIVRGEDHADGRFTPLSVSVSLHHAEQAD